MNSSSNARDKRSRRRRRFARDKRRQQVAELYLTGSSQADIAVALGVTQPTISKDLLAIQAEWRASAVRDFDLLRERELRKIDRLEREAWAAWERSQQPAQSAIVTGEGAGQQTRKSLKNQVGDPRFLDLVTKCIIQRRTLLGIDAPLQVADVTSSIVESPEERRARLEQLLQTIAAEARRRRLPVPDDCVSDAEEP